MYSISDGDVHVWKVDLDLPDSELDQRTAWLSLEEGHRAARFHQDQDRRRFIAHKSTLREILGGYLAMAPNAVQFDLDRWGKPSVANTESDALEFNTGHSGGIGLIAVRRGGEVGVDVESVIPGFPWWEVAPKALNEGEIHALKLLPAEQKSAAFFTIWTRKEALAKAVGLGMHLDLTALQVPPGVQLTDWSLHRVRLQHGEVGCALVDLECSVGYCASLALVGSPAMVRTFERTARGISSGDQVLNAHLR